jgi:cobalt-precorrin-7 (C5)-methyltransferase
LNKIYVLSVGPGSPAYLTPAVIGAAKKCDLLVGGRRNLALFGNSGKETLEISGQLQPLFATVKERVADQTVGFLVSGDASVFSILPLLVKEFGLENLEIFPGISAAQYLMARLGLCWEETCLISMHGREPEDLAAWLGEPYPLIVFTDSRNNPGHLCRLLVEAGINNKIVYIGENLSYPAEKISAGRPEDFCEYCGSDLNLVVIVNEP